MVGRGKQKTRLGGVGLGWKWFWDFAGYACTILLRALEFSQAILTATLMVVGERRRREADWFTAAVDAGFFGGVQIQFAGKAPR